MYLVRYSPAEFHPSFFCVKVFCSNYTHFFPAVVSATAPFPLSLHSVVDVTLLLSSTVINICVFSVAFPRNVDHVQAVSASWWESIPADISSTNAMSMFLFFSDPFVFLVQESACFADIGHVGAAHPPTDCNQVAV